MAEKIHPQQSNGAKATSAVAAPTSSTMSESSASLSTSKGSGDTGSAPVKVWRSGTAFSMSGLAEADLPLDIKFPILKEYIRFWATRIPKLENSLEECAPTNRATLIHPWVKERAEYGWCAIPVTTTYTLSPPPQGTWEQIANSVDCGQGLLADRLTEKIQIKKILEVGAFCRDFDAPLAAFFFGHMIWQFRFPVELERVLLSSDGQPDGPFPRALAYIKNVSLCDIYRSGDHLDTWEYFHPLLLQLHSAVTKSKAFENLEFLELIIESPMKIAFLHKCSMEARIDGLIKRIRFIVTLCYQMVQELPKLKVHFRSSRRECMGNFLALEDQSTSWKPQWFKPEEHESLYHVSQYEVEGFRNGTLQSGLPSIEFESIEEDPPVSEEAPFSKVYWQVILAREWRKIWDQGTDLKEKDGGYAAVYDCARNSILDRWV